jgi:hypothetical protein
METGKLEHTDHHWYAVRISGQATRVHKRRIVFTGPKGASHQYLVPDINQKMEIELELERIGVDYFIPMLIQEAPHRRKRNVMVARRVPMISGYAFVKRVRDWQDIEGIKCVSGVIRGFDHSPVRVPSCDIDDLQMIQWQAFCNYMDPPKQHFRRRFIEGSRHTIKHKTLGLMDVHILSVTSRNTIKVIADRLGKFEIPVDEVSEAA